MRVNAVVHGKCDRCHQFVKWRTTVDQKVKVILFYVETKSVVAAQRLFMHTLVQGVLLVSRQSQTFIRDNFPAYEV